MHHARAGLAGLLIALVVVPIARAADVTVRAEGADGTVLNTTVANTGPSVTKAGATCPGTSAAGALERATTGNWAATNFGGDLFVDAIAGTAYSFDTDGRFWNFDHTHTSSFVGVCDYDPVPAGDELLFYTACGTPSATNCFSGMPLDLDAPATVIAGQPFTVKVQQYDDSQDPAPLTPAGGATVSGGGQTVQTTPVSSTADITLTQPGTVTLTATKGTQVRDEATVTVAAAATPTATPDYTIPTPTPTAEPGDRTAPMSEILRIHEGRVFKHRRKAPRTLRAKVSEANGLAKVTLGLSRRVGKKCSAFSDTKARFVKTKCGKHPRFNLGTSPTISYLLPKRLGKGKYVLDVISTDRAGNTEPLERGLNRVVFTVK